MAITEMLFRHGKKPLTVGIVQFDCSVSESHNDSCTITEHPVEDGSTMSDHIRRDPPYLELHGIVTNTPIVFLASFHADSPIVGDKKGWKLPKKGEDRVSLAYKALQDIMDSGDVIDVITSLREYKSMVIDHMTIERNKDTGNVLDCTLSLKKIVKARLLSVDLPAPLSVVNKAKESKGKKETKPATTVQTSTAKSASSGASDTSHLGLAFGAA